MRTLTIFSAAFLTLAVAGCKPASEPTTPAADTTAQGPQPAATAGDTTAPESGQVATLAPGTIIGVSPAEMRECDKHGAVATVSWDASTLADVKVVEIWMSTENGEPKVFRRGHAKGDTQTGAWAHPGVSFFLKNAANGNEIGRTQIKSVPCA